MPLRIPVYHPISGAYAVRYAESDEKIVNTAGWKVSRQKYWALDTVSRPVSVRIRGEIFHRERNSVALYAPGVRYEELFEIGRLVSLNWLLIEERTDSSLLRKLTGERGFCFFSDPTQAVRKQIRQFVEASYLGEPAREFILAARLFDILGTLLSHPVAPQQSPKTKKRNRKSAHPWRKATWDLLEKTPSGRLTYQDVADELQLSHSTLTHRYRDHCGESLLETINGWRLEKLCTLLSETTLSVKEISVRTGFAHQSYLSNFLKEKKGVTPSEYRRLARSKRVVGKPGARAA